MHLLPDMKVDSELITLIVVDTEGFKARSVWFFFFLWGDTTTISLCEIDAITHENVIQLRCNTHTHSTENKNSCILKS